MNPIDYAGPPERKAPAIAALARVVDPEMALNIVDLGLVYGVEMREQRIRVRLTMTSAACPVAELIEEDVAIELHETFGPDVDVEVELCWEPAWTPERMSAAARDAMGM